MAMKTEDKNLQKEWAITKMPSFQGQKALILGGAFYGSIVQFFAEAGFSKAETVDDADVVVFAGGVDVDPALYGADKHPMTQTPNKGRDAYEKAIYDECVVQGKVMFGICRGAQFLHVMNGGELWQHVEGHAGPDHDIYDTENDVFVTATSYHHQMLALNSKVCVLAVTREQVSRKFESDTFKLSIGKDDVEVEIEAGYYPDTKCLFVQGHPEVGGAAYRAWSMTMLEDFMAGDLAYQRDEPGKEDIETAVENWRAAQALAS